MIRNLLNIQQDDKYAVLNVILYFLFFFFVSSCQHSVCQGRLIRLEHSVDAEDDPVTGGDVKLLDGGGAEAGPHRDALAVNVIQTPSDRDLAAARILQLCGA